MIKNVQIFTCKHKHMYMYTEALVYAHTPKLMLQLHASTPPYYCLAGKTYSCPQATIPVHTINLYSTADSICTIVKL